MEPAGFRFRVWAIVLLGLGMPSPTAAQPAPARGAHDLPSAVEAVVRSFDLSTATGHDRRLLRTVARFYAGRRFAPAWSDARGRTAAGEGLVHAMARADDEGLDARAYALPVPASRDTVATARADVLLSFLALRFAEDLGVGLAVPGSIHRDHAYARPPFNGDSLLPALAAADDAGRALLTAAPRTPGYARLREALHQLDAIARRGGWGTLPAGSTLRPGMTGERVRQLRRLLQERGDLEAADDPESASTFDAALAVAVARFQERHGLPVDSVAGRATIAALDVPVADRLEQLRLGMERIRWLPPVTAGRWITVNLADYTAFVFDDGVPVFDTRVVVGARNHKTPMFVATLSTIVLNPAWNVPPSIRVREIVPRLRRDPAYLERNHMVWVGHEIRQLPGPWNALGQIAFMFPNAFNVYMHDTPAKELFALADRAHSHGCIRVQRPHELAERLLARDGWSRARLDSVIATGRRTVVPLPTPIPVRITYATAFMGRDGTLQFRPDVYGRDALLQRALVREHQRPLPAVFR